MQITAAEIEAAKSERGGWNKETLAKWGIAWPPKRGWRKRLIAASEQEPKLSPEEQEKLHEELAANRPSAGAMLEWMAARWDSQGPGHKLMERWIPNVTGSFYDAITAAMEKDPLPY
jgi:hypothetical protein